MGELLDVRRVVGRCSLVRGLRIRGSRGIATPLRRAAAALRLVLPTCCSSSLRWASMSRTVSPSPCSAARWRRSSRPASHSRKVSASSSALRLRPSRMPHRPLHAARRYRAQAACRPWCRRRRARTHQGCALGDHRAGRHGQGRVCNLPSFVAVGLEPASNYEPGAFVGGLVLASPPVVEVERSARVTSQESARSEAAARARISASSSRGMVAWG